MVNDHFYSAPWEAMLVTFESFGNENFGSDDFVSRLANRADCDHIMSSGRVPTFYISEYFELRLKENLPLNQHESGLCEFVKAYCSYTNLCPMLPPSDLPLDFPIVFRPERVQQIASRLTEIDITAALDCYQCVRRGGPVWHSGNWTRSLMNSYLAEVITFWKIAAINGRAILHMEF